MNIYCLRIRVAGAKSLRIQQMNVQCDTKTKDNVFVKVSVAIQYNVIPGKVFDAFYKLSDDKAQIRFVMQPNCNMCSIIVMQVLCV